MVIVGFNWIGTRSYFLFGLCLLIFMPIDVDIATISYVVVAAAVDVAVAVAVVVCLDLWDAIYSTEKEVIVFECKMRSVSLKF